jgi:O-antigen ligase
MTRATNPNHPGATLAPVATAGAPGEVAARPAFYIFVLLAGLALLPFTKALTVDVGFPLKLYEPIFGAAVFTAIFSRLEFGWALLRRYLLPLILFLAVAVTSYLLLVFSNETMKYTFRGGAALDGLARVAYLALNIAIFALCFFAALKHHRALILFWILGAIVSASYVIYTSVATTLDYPAILLPGLERHQLWGLGPFSITRSGTFDEGNFAGLYFLLTVVLAFLVRNYVGIAFGLAGLIISLSTSAYIGLLIVAAVYVLQRRSAVAMVPVLILLSVIGFFMIDYFIDQGKFDSVNSSGAVRLNEFMTALSLFRDHIWFGAGLGQYGFQYDYYVWNPAVNELTVSDRHIPNNVYVEILAETGLLGFIFFGIFMKNWVRQLITLSGGSRILFAGAMGLLVGWLAYPTFAVAFIWAFFGISAGVVEMVSKRKVAIATFERESRSAADELVPAI